MVFPAGAAAAPDYVPHEVIVGYAPRAVAGRRAAARMHAMVVTAVSASPRPRPRASAAPAPRSQVVHLPPSESVTAAIARLRRKPGVAYAVPNYIAHAAGAWYPNDRGRTNRPQGWEKTQWNLLAGNGIGAPEAWWNLLTDHHPGGRGVTVAILDTGVAYRNWRGFHQSPDFRGTRFVSPYDFVNHNRFPLDRNGHGTFVAGVVAEATNNGFGLTGIAYGASVMPVRVLDASGLGDETTIARGIRYAVNHRAQVINLSLEFLPDQVSSGSAIPQIVSALNYAHRRGVTVVGAAGNDEDSQIAYPARVANSDLGRRHHQRRLPGRLLKRRLRTRPGRTGRRQRRDHAHRSQLQPGPQPAVDLPADADRPAPLGRASAIPATTSAPRCPPPRWRRPRRW